MAYPVIRFYSDTHENEPVTVVGFSNMALEIGAQSVAAVFAQQYDRGTYDIRFSDDNKPVGSVSLFHVGIKPPLEESQLLPLVDRFAEVSPGGHLEAWDNRSELPGPRPPYTGGQLLVLR